MSNHDSERLLVYLIRRMALSPDFRSKTLDGIADYLQRAAAAKKCAIDDIVVDHERYALAALYRLLGGFHETYLVEGLTPQQADAKAADWFTKRLEEFLSAEADMRALTEPIGPDQ